MTVTLQRASKVYRHPKTGVETHKVGYVMDTFVYTMSKLKPGEPIPKGLIHPTGEGDVPGLRNHVAGDAMLIGYAERIALADIPKQFRAVYDDPSRVPLALTPFGKRAAKHSEIIGAEPPVPIRKIRRIVNNAIATMRADGYADFIPSNGTGERQRRTA